MKIAIIYIATGSYIDFFAKYYDSAEKNFIPSENKTYFVFTDREFPYAKKSNVIVIPQHQEYWPFSALHKFHYILEAQHLLKNFDFLLMTNANLQFVTPIELSEILPNKEENHLVAVEGPWVYKNKYRMKNFPKIYFNNSPNSQAYVPPEKRKKYFASGFLGGRTPEFLQMAWEIRNMIERDLSKNYIAEWHDQDYVNKYLLVNKDLKIKILPPSFLYPAEYDIPFEKRIFMPTKKKKGDFMMAYYRKYHWTDGKKHKTKIGKIKSYIIYQIIKTLKKLDK